jgi:hypothetical protein
MKLIVRDVKELQSSEYQACYGLNLRDKGLMRDRLVECRHTRQGYVVMLFENDVLLSWALVWAYDLAKDQWGAYFYTRESQRRKGYGSKVAGTVKENWTNITSWPSDDIGYKFFDRHKFKQNYRWYR